MLGTMGFPLAFTRTRLPPRRTGPLVEWAAFKEMPYALYAIGITLCFWGMYFAFYYIGNYGVTILGVSEKQSISLLLILNGCGVPGRLVPNFIADHYLGPLNTMIPFALISAVLIYAWIAVTNQAGLITFACFYGMFASGLLSLFPAALSSLTTDLRKAGVRMGMVMSCLSFACLTGPPIGGALIQLEGGGFVYAQAFAGSAVACGLLFLIAARLRITGLVLARKV
ncbi:MAG: hypothetical protein M1830_001052 [Pleopsidium flavum]|nr:MAG: hypothetical protein M1830_001052 [Pleopsidium flavum]